MRRDRAGSAIAARDAGLRRVTRLTWQVTAAGAVCSALIAAAFGHGTSQQNASQRSASQHGVSQHGASQHGGSQHGASQPQAGSTGQTQRSGHHHHGKHHGAGPVIPSQPPAPASGAGQVTSGGS
jgi:hypothetical protein